MNNIKIIDLFDLSQNYVEQIKIIRNNLDYEWWFDKQEKYKGWHKCIIYCDEHDNVLGYLIWKNDYGTMCESDSLGYDDPGKKSLHCVYVQELFVKQNMRGKGIATCLLNKLFKLYCDDTIYRANANMKTNQAKKISITFYTKNGFKEYISCAKYYSMIRGDKDICD